MRFAARRSTLLSLILLVGFVVIPTAMTCADEAQWRQLSERWYIFEIAGAKAGWMHETVETDGERFRTSNETRLRIGRGDIETGVRISTSFVETTAGEPISMTSNQAMSSQPVNIVYEFTDDGVAMTTSQGGRTVTRELPAPDGEWLTPQAMQRFLEQRHEARPKEFTYRMIEPTNGIEPVTVTTKFTREDEFQLGERTVPVTVWTSQTSVMPVDAIEMYSADDVLVYYQANLPMGNMVMRLSDRATATADGAGPPPELLVSGFARSNRPLERDRHARQVRYVLTARNGRLTELPTAGAQRVTASTKESATLLVDIDDNVAATEEELTSDDFRTASAMIDSDDPLVRKLTGRALRNVDDADNSARADALHEFVFEHISDKGLETAFASASETARTRTGDCSEHGVLLAAMLRAAGIPSRVATGLLYVGEDNGEGLFGWHMWTQALIDGRWIDFDATLPTRYTAGHILTSTSSFSDTSSSSELNALMALIGNLDIEVRDYEAAPATVE